MRMLNSSPFEAPFPPFFLPPVSTALQTPTSRASAVENRFAGNEAAVEVYQHMKGGFAFAKTQWLVDQMASEFGVRAHKIAPTVDTARFNPVQRTPNGKVHVCAMVRVETPRRNPEGTLVVLQALMNRFPNVTVSIFGSPPAALEQLVSSGKVKGINLAAMNNIGIAERDAVTAVMQQSDIFIDASTCVRSRARAHASARACALRVCMRSITHAQALQKATRTAHPLLIPGA
jgi:hypothetical protein